VAQGLEDYDFYSKLYPYLIKHVFIGRTNIFNCRFTGLRRCLSQSPSLFVGVFHKRTDRFHVRPMTTLKSCRREQYVELSDSSPPAVYPYSGKPDEITQHKSRAMSVISDIRFNLLSPRFIYIAI
jgi:hypothetical protein